MRLPPPSHARDVFRMLCFYEPARGLDGIVERFDFTGVAPAHLQRIVLGAVPKGTPMPPPADIGEYFKSLLASDAFRRVSLRNFLDAFPEKRRLLFVHIPKCAGTDLTAALSERYFALSGTTDNPHWWPPERLFPYLRELALACPFVNTLFVHGHTKLRFYVNQNLVRPGDRIFTVVRDPVDIIVSAINYRIMRLRTDPAGKETDTRLWLRDLGLTTPPALDTREAQLALAKRMLREPKVTESNTLCSALGSGDAATALSNIIASDIEFTDMRRYEAWLQARWRIGASQHANMSTKVLTAAMLDREDRALVESKTVEDQKLYARLVAALDAAAEPCVHGRLFA